MISIIDYGAGNLRSVQKAVELLGREAIITSNPDEIRSSEKIIFPGVGSFARGMEELLNRKLLGPVAEFIRSDKPFLGICLGYQLLFSGSEEAPGVKGLGILKGKVVKFPEGELKVPQMGWNQIKIKNQSCALFKDVPDNSFMYFVHSYYPVPEDKSIIATETEYSASFASSICQGNVYGTQFHPEKSHKVGLKILENFIKC